MATVIDMQKVRAARARASIPKDAREQLSLADEAYRLGVEAGRKWVTAMKRSHLRVIGEPAT